MLKRLSILNLAIFENAEVSFDGGFTVLTGATGAGKSLVIDSLSLLLGARASSDLIRQGENKASIVGVFSVSSSRLKGLLDAMEIPYEDELVIERNISHGKNTIKANGVALSLGDLNRLARILADIHNQFDFARIIDPDNYLSIIDGFAFEKLAPYKARMAESYASYQKEAAAYEKLRQEKATIEAQKEFYSYQYEELKRAALFSGEEEELDREISLLKNYDKIYSLTQEVSSIVHEDFLDRFYELVKTLGKLADYQNQYKDSHAALEENYYAVEDGIASLKKNLGDLDYDPSRLEGLLQRQADLAALKRKYKRDYETLVTYRDELASLLNAEKYSDDALTQKKEAVEKARQEALTKAKELSAVRKAVAKSIEKEMGQTLTDLLLRASFHIEFGDAELSEEGTDQVAFLIETNIGEGLKNLDKVVSGGEASRIMLALKSVFIKANKVGTVIFDEIDTGLSGEAASAVARKIAEIAMSTQVIAITHLPQVASLSDHHILISKQVRNGRTYASIKELDLEGKIEEVAHLISGDNLTKTQLEYAREMVLATED